MRPMKKTHKESGKQPLYQTVYLYFRQQIESGFLAVGNKLPSIRQMTRDSGVSRTTVETAYEQLCADGYVICRPQSGYYVSDLHIQSKPIQTGGAAQEITDKEFEYDFSGKRMDSREFDFQIWRKLAKNVMQDSEPFMAYGFPQGEPKLREQIAKYLSAGRGVYASSEQIIIGAGVQSLLHLFCAMTENAQTKVAFETPGFPKGYQIFQDHKVPATFVPGDGQGIDIRRLYESGANVLYVSPSHTFPTGATMPHQKRQEILRWSADTDGLIIEDDYDGELKYSGKPLATLTSLDRWGHVFYLGTFSKLLPPSLRISYLILPEAYVETYQKIAANYNQTSSTMEQLTMASYIENGFLEKQIRRLRRIYGRKNAEVTRAFAKYFGDMATVYPNDTGLHVTVSLQTALSAGEICEKAEKRGIGLTPMANQQEGEHARIYMSCASIREEKIEEAIGILRELMKEGE